MDDEDLFAKAMSVVRPLAKPDKVKVEKPKQKYPKRQQHRDIQHRIQSSVSPFSSSSAGVAPEAGEQPWILKASGVSQEKLKQLGAGKPAIDIEVDLHGMRRDEAIKSMERLLMTALDERARVLCVVHGRGLHSQGKPILKESVYQWLRSGPYASHILAAIPKPYTGGGSALILLRRSRS